MDEKAKSIIKQTKELAKRVQKTHNLDEIESTRVAFSSIMALTAKKIGTTLDYSEGEIERYREACDTSEIESDLGYLIANPAFLDALYESVVSATYRKKFGQFLTPDYVAEFMAAWLNQGKINTVLDPAVGSGVFLEKVVKTCGSRTIDLWGFDIDPLMLNACKLRLAMAGIDISSLHLEKQDFVRLNLFSKEFDGVICNPPYLNFHDFERNFLVKGVESRYGIRLSRLTNIYSLFFMQSLFFANKGARIAFITPSEFLYTGYGEELKTFLLRYTTLDALILVDFKALVFPDALTTAVITLFRKGTPKPNHKVRFMRVFEWPGIATMLKILGGEAETSRHYRMKVIAQNALEPKEKWLEHFQKNNYANIVQRLVPLSEIANIDRGIATGQNDYFALSEPEVKKWGIEERFLKPIISKTIQCKGYEFRHSDWEELRNNGDKCFLLYCFDTLSPNLREYITYGEKIGVDRRYLTRHRDPWYSMERREPAKILATVFSRGRMRFILNGANVRNLTAFHCIYPKFHDTKMVKALLAYLNSELCKEIQTIKRREYGGGLHKFEPRDLEQLPTIDVQSLQEEDLIRLSALFDKLCLSVQHEEEERKVKEQLDIVLKSVIMRSPKLAIIRA